MHRHILPPLLFLISCGGGSSTTTALDDAQTELPPSASSLIAHWTFDEGAGISVQDVSGSGFDALLMGEPEWEPGALRFDGVDDIAAVPPPSPLTTLSAGTIALRFRYEVGAAVESLPLLYFGADEARTAVAGNEDVTIYIGHGNLQDPRRRQIYFTVHRQDKVALCFDSDLISLEEGVWHHYTVTIGPEGHHGYLNGLEFSRHYNAGTGPESDAFFDTVETPDVFEIGHGSFGVTGRWHHLRGAVDDARFYDRVLTPEEIQQLAGP